MMIGSYSAEGPLVTVDHRSECVPVGGQDACGCDDHIVGHKRAIVVFQVHKDRPQHLFVGGRGVHHLQGVRGFC